MTSHTFGQSRELQTIFQIAKLLAHQELPFAQILQRVAEELPKGFKYEEVCRARILSGMSTMRVRFPSQHLDSAGAHPGQGGDAGRGGGRLPREPLQPRPRQSLPSGPEEAADLTALKLGQDAEARQEGPEAAEAGRHASPIFIWSVSRNGGRSWICWERSIRISITG